VPILVGRQVHGCVSLIYIASALTVTEVEKRLLPPLRDMTLRLAEALQAEKPSLAKFPAARA
jgi:hypothetical protein